MPSKLRTAEFDAKVIAEYETHRSAAPVARKLGISTQTVYRVLKSHGIRRTKPKPEPVRRLSNCKTDICPALVVQLSTIIGLTGKQIASVIGCSASAIYRILKQEKGEGVRYRYHFKTCPICGNTFKTTHSEICLCNDCQPRPRNSNHRKRARYFRVKYEAGITLDALIERDANTCQICGKECNRNDLAWGHFGPTYPTIDHIVPMHYGGNHTWENVQLAHLKCNILKSDKVVKQDAEEQAATNERARIN